MPEKRAQIILEVAEAIGTHLRVFELLAALNEKLKSIIYFDAVPGLGSIAQHQGRYVGKLIAARIAGSAPPTPPEPFVPSKLATITRHVGVAEFGGRSITGFPAWLMWGLLLFERWQEAIQNCRYWQTG